MRSHAFILACLVLGAHAASINPPEDKLDALDNVDLDEVISEPEQIDQITVNEVEKNPVAEIPVSIVEEQQLKKIDENSNDYVPDINESVVIKRAQIDLKNPGPPQRQEHETQNPSHFSDKEKSLISVREKLEQTQQVFTEQIKSVSTNFETLIQSSENLPVLQRKIQELNSSFADQIVDLNNTLQSYINPSSEKLKTDLKPEVIPNKKIIESNLKKVQNNFDNGISVLSEGVELLAIIQQEDEAIKGKASESSSATTTTAAPINQGNILQTLWNNFYNAVSNPITAIQNAVNQNQGTQSQSPSANVQADEPSTQRPFIQGLQTSWQNFINATQNGPFSQITNALFPRPQASQAVPSRPILPQPSNAVPAAQNAPLQNVNPQEQSSQQQSQSSEPQPQSSQPQPQSSQPQPESSQPQPQSSQPQPGPIQQLIQNNPIIRGIQNAVQRVQAPTTPNPSKPREKAEEIKEDPKGHGGNINNQGDNNDCERVKEDAAQAENLEKDKDVQEEVKEEQKTEEKPLPAAEKTE